MTYDAVVIGGSYAGLSAAMQIARARRPVCVVDTGKPRNRFADASHGFFGQDGAAPEGMIATARDQLAAYSSVRMIAEMACDATHADGGFEVTLASGGTVAGRKLVLAFGISDVLPVIPGLAERWGDSVLHCPYCHGYEHRDGRLGVLWTAPLSAHQAALIADWGTTTLYLNGNPLAEGDARTLLNLRGVSIEAASIQALRGKDRKLTSLLLGDGRRRRSTRCFWRRARSSTVRSPNGSAARSTTDRSARLSGPMPPSSPALPTYTHPATSPVRPTMRPGLRPTA